MSTILNGNVQITGDLGIAGNLTGHTRTDLATETGSEFDIPLTDLRVWDAIQTTLPGTSANDDLGIAGNTFGTGSPQVETSDLKAAGSTTRYARFLARLPYNYVATGSVSIKLHAGMETTIADTAATVDVEAYKSDGAGGIGSDLVTTSATTINSLTSADKSFALTAGSLSPGDVLDVRVTVLVNDGATGTEVKAAIGSIALVCNTKG
jgi:hypothetical protein